MSTTELIIVFAALMTLIALVTIGIDWIGRPLKHRRFIPRIYRFDDEKLPVDAYGHPQLDAPQPDVALPAAPGAPAHAWAPPVGYQQPPPVVVATVAEPLTAASAPKAPPAPAPVSAARADVESPESVTAGADAESTLDYGEYMGQTSANAADSDEPTTPDTTADTPTDSAPDATDIDEPTTADTTADTAAGGGKVSTSAFSDRVLASDSGSVPAVGDAAWTATGLVPDQVNDSTGWDGDETIERYAEADAVSASGWEPGMPLDATVNDERPSMATKAERYWQATAAATETSHFDTEALDRMTSGRAPRRRNPRSSRVETMQLTGLRRASSREDVRPSWPDSSVDPWAAS